LIAASPAYLHDRTTVLKVVHTLTGSSGCFNFRLIAEDVVSELLDSHALVRIVGPLNVTIRGPITSTVATSVTVALCPNKYVNWPDQEAQVCALEGSTTAEHSLMVASRNSVLGIAREIEPQLKPILAGTFDPVVVGHWTVAGGVASSVSLLIVSFKVEVDGIGHLRTW